MIQQRQRICATTLKIWQHMYQNSSQSSDIGYYSTGRWDVKLSIPYHTYSTGRCKYIYWCHQFCTELCQFCGSVLIEKLCNISIKWSKHTHTFDLSPEMRGLASEPGWSSTPGGSSSAELAAAAASVASSSMTLATVNGDVGFVITCFRNVRNSSRDSRSFGWWCSTSSQKL